LNITGTLTNAFSSSSIVEKNVVKRTSTRYKKNKSIPKGNYKDKIKDIDNNKDSKDNNNNNNNNISSISGNSNDNSNINSNYSSNTDLNGEIDNISSAYISFDILQELSLLIGIRLVVVNSLNEIKKISQEEKEEIISVNASHNILIINLEKVIHASKEVTTDLYSNYNIENSNNSLKDLIAIATLQSESILSFLHCREGFLFQNNINNTITNASNSKSSINKTKKEGTYNFWKSIESLQCCLNTSQINHLSRYSTIDDNTIDNNDLDNIIDEAKPNTDKQFICEAIQDIELLNWLYRAHQSKYTL
jgi:hypothetical protein